MTRMSAQTYNFVVLMVFFMVLLWIVKTLVKARKLWRLYSALTKNLVIRLDGEVQHNQHLDAISLSHLQQILNSNLAHSSTPMKDLRVPIHVNWKSPNISKCNPSDPSTDYALNFLVDSENKGLCEVYFGVTTQSLKRIQNQRPECDLKGSDSPASKTLEEGDYIFKATTELGSGTDMKASIVVPAARYNESLDGSRYPAVIRVSTIVDCKRQNKAAFEFTMLKHAGVTSPPNSTPAVKVDHQIIGINDQLLHIKDIFGKEEDGECLICMTDPKDTILLPCRHMCLCRECLLKMVTAKCPICRTTIDQHISFKRIETESKY